MNALLNEVGTIAGLVIISLYIAVIMDGFVMFNIMIREVADAKEYAAAVLKWTKIIVLYAAGAFMLLYVIDGQVSFYIKVTEGVLSLLLFADAILSTIIKSKYGKKG
ncbi:MAG: hypothetical protein J1F11_05055 [Oscillospiraceae bacterium]|nr:hypothetical protein [Oscillospiraceae bacterium]